MSVFRLHRHDKGFASIDNATLRDRRLSFRARGVLAYLLAQPKESSTDAVRLAAESAGEGRDAIRTALTELEAAGYLVRERSQDEAGRWSTVVHVWERPEDANAENPTPGNPSSVRPAEIEEGAGPTDAWETDAGFSGPKDEDENQKTLLPEDVTLAAAPRKEPDELWESLEACFGPAPKNKGLRAAWGVACKEIRDQGGGPRDVPVRLALYRVQMPQAAATPMALAKHWGRLVSPASRPVSKFEAARAERRLRDATG